MADLTTKIAGLTMKNPVMTASGTFGYGVEFADFVNLEDIGGIIVKGTTLNPREGNDYPRMVETASGMLNCVGLQNKGVDYFCTQIYPEIKDIKTNMIVNVSGSSLEDYAECAARINELENIPAIELNISCPNVKQGGMAFGVTTEGAAAVVKAVRDVYKKTLIVKLSPNVTSIVDIARVVEDAGAENVHLNIGDASDLECEVGAFGLDNVSSLGCMVHAGAAGDAKTCAGSNVEVCALVALLDHLLDEVVHAVGVAKEVCLGDPLDVLDGQLPYGTGCGNAGVGNHDVYLAEVIHGEVEELFNFFGEGHVCNESCNRSADLLNLFFGSLEADGVNVVDNDLHAALCAFDCDCLTYAAAGAGHDQYFIFKFFHCFSPSFN